MRKSYVTAFVLIIVGLCTNAWAATPLPLCEPYSSSFTSIGDRVYFEVYADAGKNLFVTFDGDNNSGNSLYIKYNQIPTTTDYDDKDYDVQDPAVGVYGTQAGVYYIMVVSEYLYSTYKNYTITACYHLTDLKYPLSSQFKSIGDRRYFQVNTLAGQNLTVTFDGDTNSGNSLYIKYNQIPTTTDYDDKDYDVQDPAVGVYGTQAGVYYIMVVSEYLYSTYKNYTITASSSTITSGPAVYLSLNKTSFHTGETIIANAIVTNGPNPYKVEAKVYVSQPDSKKISLFDEHFTFMPGANANITKEVLRYTFIGTEQPGTYEIVIRLEDVTTGADFWVDRKSFEFTP